MRREFYTLILEPNADIPRQSIPFDEDQFVRASKRRVGQKDPHVQVRIGETLLTARQLVYMSSDIVEQGSMNFQQFAFLVGRRGAQHAAQFFIDAPLQIVQSTHGAPSR